jgi:hypothetical protein
MGGYVIVGLLGIVLVGGAMSQYGAGVGRGLGWFALILVVVAAIFCTYVVIGKVEAPELQAVVLAGAVLLGILALCAKLAKSIAGGIVLLLVVLALGVGLWATMVVY